MSASVNVFEYHSGNLISVSYCGSDVTLFHIYASWFSPPSYQGRKGEEFCAVVIFPYEKPWWEKRSSECLTFVASSHFILALVLSTFVLINEYCSPGRMLTVTALQK